ncbi:MAG TPA: thioesterase family protein [Castellaniella sp.]|jgi:acyl-CoA thioester hydrolase|nr:thioesterase family protein [Castellaniella sp.]
MNATSRSDYRYFHTVQARWMDNDVYGHLNNAVYYSLFDTAIAMLLSECGADLFDTGGLNRLVVKSGCEYLSSLRFPGTITVGVKIAALGNSSIRYAVAAFGEDGDAAAAQGEFIHVCVGADDHRPVRIPDSLREALSRYA